MKKIIFLCILIILCLDTVIADSLKGGYPGCVSKKLYEQFMSAYMQSNQSECEYLLKNGCFFFPGGLKISVLEQSILKAQAQVRVFAGDQTIILWTHYKNVKSENGD